jgi:hypothetical protein
MNSPRAGALCYQSARRSISGLLSSLLANAFSGANNRIFSFPALSHHYFGTIQCEHGTQNPCLPHLQRHPHSFLHWGQGDEAGVLALPGAVQPLDQRLLHDVSHHPAPLGVVQGGSKEGQDEGVPLAGQNLELPAEGNKPPLGKRGFAGFRTGGLAFYVLLRRCVGHLQAEVLPPRTAVGAIWEWRSQSGRSIGSYDLSWLHSNNWIELVYDSKLLVCETRTASFKSASGER